METDELIQQTLRREMASATVLTIAHRLETIMAGDTVVVMGDGRVVESGPPQALLSQRGGEFARMHAAAQLGDAVNQLIGHTYIESS